MSAKESETKIGIRTASHHQAQKWEKHANYVNILPRFAEELAQKPCAERLFPYKDAGLYCVI